jgi:hypothetical protein
MHILGPALRIAIYVAAVTPELVLADQYTVLDPDTLHVLPLQVLGIVSVRVAGHTC